MSRSDTRTETRSITARDVREVWQHTSAEISRLLCQARGVVADFDLDTCSQHLAIFGLHDIISAACLQFYLGNELVAEYRYEILDDYQEAWGPGPEEAPLTQMPPGACVRLVVYDNEDCPADVRDDWYRKLGWYPVDDLDEPDDVTSEVYGCFASGGYSVRRHLRANPRYTNMRPSRPARGGR